ncbi:MAG: polyphosphate polymerase domain-containing protein [Bacteroidia bacterium]|nr:polyphosphate polymerase domain-containing protein [Bacteroidia bacterium]
MRAELNNILSGFDAITLEQMDAVKLMDRMDTKFIFRNSMLPEYLDQLRKHYRVLEIGGLRGGRYETLYYDTEGFSLYHAHQAGKLNRYKVRSRKYLDSNLCFFEVKFKSNKGRTVKERIKCPTIEEVISGRSADFLAEASPLKAAALCPSAWIYYTRITMVNNNSPERLTLDVDLNVRFGGREKSFSDMVIAEVKQSRSTPSPFIRLMHDRRLREGSISKYCLGVIHTQSNVKINNFKPRLRRINKVIYGKSM